MHEANNQHTDIVTDAFKKKKKKTWDIKPRLWKEPFYTVCGRSTFHIVTSAYLSCVIVGGVAGFYAPTPKYQTTITFMPTLVPSNSCLVTEYQS